MLPRMMSEPAGPAAPADIGAMRAEMNALPGWYHNIDLGGGLVTPGRGLHALWDIDRRLMALVDFHGKAVLDIGAMDGMWSFEAERRGAASVVATDAYPWGLERFLFCKRALNSRVRGHYDVSVYELATALTNRLGSRPSFDVVLCFGVLYHLRDPLLALAQIRSVLKQDGIALIETAFFHSRKPVMYFNSRGKLFYDDPTTWWAPSWPCLRDMCEASLLDAARVDPQDRFELRERFQKVGRLGFVARPLAPDRLDRGYLDAIRGHYPPPPGPE